MKNPTVKAVQHRLVGLREAMLGVRRESSSSEFIKGWQNWRRGAYLAALQIIRELK